MKRLLALLITIALSCCLLAGCQMHTENGITRITLDLNWQDISVALGDAVDEIGKIFEERLDDALATEPTLPTDTNSPTDANDPTEPTTPSIANPEIPDGSQLQVHYIDVGQADSILLICDGEYLLIDAGEKDSNDTVTHYLSDLGITSLDLIIATHAHSDHIGDMADVLQAIPAEVVWYPDYRHGTKAETNFLTAATNCGADLYQPELGQTYELGSATVTVLGPVKEYTDPNDMSIVVMVQHGQTRFLFTGDMENVDAAENDLIAYWGEDALKADVLKVGHHGARTSTSYHFLRSVMPEYAVISVGTGNSYGHPTQETLNILGQAEVYVYRTDYMGTIVATSDGTDISFAWDNQAASPYIPEQG